MCLTKELYKPTSGTRISSKDLPCLKMGSCKDGRLCKVNHVNSKLYLDLATRLKTYAASIDQKEKSSLQIMDAVQEVDPQFESYSMNKIKTLSPAHIETHLYDDEGRPGSTKDQICNTF